jgi:serine phosphatase RsbU (regulator of sigma subunit)/CHASE2 domain-containing sensor protein
VLLLGLLAALVLIPEIPGLRALRSVSFDAYQSLVPRVRRVGPVVIVAIDEESLRRHGQWPWPRTWLARIVGTVADARPAAIGIDILMPEPDRLSPARLPELVAGLDREVTQRLASLPGNDTVLAQAMRGRRVVLGIAGLETHGPEASGAVRQVPVRSIGGDPAPLVRRFTAALRSLDEIDRAAVGHGLTSVDPERGVVRRAPLLARVGDGLVASFGVEMLRVVEGAPPLLVRMTASGIEAVRVGDFVLPSAPDGSAWIHYTRHDPTRFVSAADVLAARADPQLFQDRLVLIGVTALGLADYQATPVADRMSGVEIHAQVLENMVEGSLLSRPPLVRWAEVGMLLIAGLLLIVLVPRLPARVSVALWAGVIAVVAGLGLILYLRSGVLLDVVTPSLALATLFSVMLVATLTETESQRRALRRQVERQREAAARLAGELEAARRIQLGTLPRPSVSFPGETRFDLYARLDPAREVGGDLYDFFLLDRDHLFFMIGDVSGKGLPGSLFMAISKALYKSTALRRHGQVAAMMREADAEISRDNAEGLFVTVLAGILDAGTGALEYCSAGHEPPVLLPRGAQALQRLQEGGGPPLCAVDEFPYTPAVRQLEAGDTLVLITDGITEAADPAGLLYGRPRLEALLGGLAAAASATEVGEAIRRDVAAFTGGAEPSDDMAILVLRWFGPTAR